MAAASLKLTPAGQGETTSFDHQSLARRRYLPGTRIFLHDHNLVSSMSRRGNCWNNEVAELFLSRLKKSACENASIKPGS